MSSPTTISSLTTFEVGRWLPPALSERLGYTPDAEICIKTKFLVGSGVIGVAIWGLAFWAAREYHYTPLTWIGAGLALTLNTIVIKYGREKQPGEDSSKLTKLEWKVTELQPDDNASYEKLSAYSDHVHMAYRGHTRECLIAEEKRKEQADRVKEAKLKLDSEEEALKSLTEVKKQHLELLIQTDQEIGSLRKKYRRLEDPRTPDDIARYKKCMETSIPN